MTDLDDRGELPRYTGRLAGQSLRSVPQRWQEVS